MILSRMVRAVAIIAGVLFASAAFAQVGTPVTVYDGTTPVSTSHPMPVSGTFSATLSGFTPNLNFATLTATGSSASVALPAGTVVFFQNAGTTTVSCTLGIGSATATANEIQVPANSGVPVVVGSNTFGACIDQSGSASNLVVLAGGSGLGTPFGGGSSSGLSGSVSNASSGVATSSTNIGAVSWLYGYNGTTWDQLQVDGSKNLKVNAPITSWAGGTLGSMANYGTSPGAVLVPGVNAFVTNANANGVNTAANSSPTVNALDLVNSTTGNIAANNTTAVVVNAAATTVYSIQLGGIGSAPAYLKLYNATSATCGSGTPVKRLIIPAAATAANGAGSNIVFPLGLRFSTGLTYCVTTGITDADTTAPAASTYLINIDWH